MNKNKRLNIIRGGVAKQIPGMPNYYFMKGLPHELGGIDIGKNLEVEGNEVVHVGKDNIKVYSSVPFLNGVSPAEKVLGGDNPTIVFKEQEQFKKINGLKDDGTKKKLGGEDDDGIDFNYDPDIVGTSPKEIIKYYTNKGFGKSPITNEWGFISKNGYNYNSEKRRDRYDKEFNEVNKIGYIGGSPTEARRKFYKSDKRFTQVVDSIADSHGLPRRVLKNSLANEGFIDTAIGDINTNYLKRRKGEAGYDNLIGDNLLNKHIYNIGFTRMGNDDSKTYYNTRKDVKRIIDNSPIKWETVRNINEKDREVLTMDGSNNKANIVIHSALLTSFRNEIKKQHPNWTNDQIDNYTLYRFNYGPYAKGNINDVMKRDKFNAKNYEFRLGGKMNNKTSGLYSLTIDGKNSLHQFPSTGKSFARSAKGKVIARGGTKKPYQGEIKADNRSWIKRKWDNVKGFFTHERPDILDALETALTWGTNHLDDVQEMVIGRKVTQDPNVQTGVAPGVGRKRSPFKNKRTLGSVKNKRNNAKPANVKSNNSPNNPKPSAEPTPNVESPNTSTAPNNSSNNTTANNTKTKSNSFADEAKKIGTIGRRQIKKALGNEDAITNNVASITGYVPVAAVTAKAIDSYQEYDKSIQEEKAAKQKLNDIKNKNNTTLPNDTITKSNVENEIDSVTTNINTEQTSNSASKVNTNDKPTPTKSNNPSTKVSTSTTTPSTSATTSTNKPVNTKPVNTRPTNNNGSTNNWIVPEFNTGVNSNNTTYDPITNMRVSKSTNYNADNKILGISAKPQFPTGKINPISLDNISPLIDLGESNTKTTNNGSNNTIKGKSDAINSVKPSNFNPINYKHYNSNGKLYSFKEKPEYSTYEDRPFTDDDTKNWMPITTNTKLSTTPKSNNNSSNIKLNKEKTSNDKNTTGPLLYHVNGEPQVKLNDVVITAKQKPKNNNTTTGGKSKDNDDFHFTFKKNNVGDYIGLGSNILSSIIGYNINKNMLNDLEYSPAPITRRANKLKTKININPQIDAMRELLANYRQHINDNTASSRVARTLMNRGLNTYTSGINQLYGNKENQETELINKDRLNQQEVINANIADYNTWRANKTEFNNKIINDMSENRIGLINNINTGVQNMLSNMERRKRDKNIMLSYMVKSPNVNPEILKKWGIEL